MLIIAALAGLLLLVAPAVRAADVTNTKHNLTASGPGSVRVGGGGEACIYCHTPHAASPVAPLWNRNDPGTFYETYESSTLKAQVGQPTGSSRLCLSCHDGTIALGQTYNPRNTAASTVTLARGHAGYIGTDLRDDHPISFRYDSALAAQQGELSDPAGLPPELPLDHTGQLQCSTCHNPHDDTNGMFLRMNNNQSRLCTSCHQVTDWAASPHATSSAALATAARDDWSNLRTASTVADAGCESCHRPHSGGGRPRLLRRDIEEDNCYSCHDGTVATSDILTQQRKLSAHPVDRTVGVHDPVEDPRTMPQHVECADCHDPHRIPAAGAVAAAAAPAIKPSMRGASGIDSTGTFLPEARNEYEVCYKCHTGGDPAGTPLIDRVFGNADLAQDFSPNNASFHPVQMQGKNPNVPSLLQPLTSTSMVYCTDCHASNSGVDGAEGPHGSDFAPLLIANYTTTDLTAESPQAYALCYSCHSRDSLLADQSFASHRMHVVDSQTSCATCHDAHGVDATQAGAGGGTHLINFDRTVVQPTSLGEGPTFTDQGTLHGTCTLTCHGKEHVNLGY